MNSSPMILRFSSRIGDALETTEALPRIDVDERHVEVAVERLDSLPPLVLAHGT